MRIDEFITSLRKNRNIIVTADNGEVKIKAAQGDLTEDIIETIRSRKQEIIRFFKNVGKGNYTSAIPRAEKKRAYPLSSAQRRLYFLYELDSNTITYNIPKVIRLEGKVDRERLTATFSELFKRHESLRTYFSMSDGEPVQMIAEKVASAPEFFSASAETAASVIQTFIRPFDLSIAPLIRTALVMTAPDIHLLVVDMHHIIADGVSQDILIRDFISLYKGESLPAPQLQYKDFAEWQQSAEQRERMATQLEYWLREFEFLPPPVELPADFQRPAVMSSKGGSLYFSIDGGETKKLRLLAEKNDSTLFTVLLSAWYVLLHKLTGQQDLVVGTPVAARTHADLENVMGMFVNMLPLRNAITPDRTFKDFLLTVRTKTLEAYDNQNCPYEWLIDKLKTGRDINHNPLFDVVFALQNSGTATLELPGLMLKSCDDAFGISKFDLTLFAFEKESELLFAFEYSTDLFRKETIENFINYFRKVIAAVVDDPGITISSIDLLNDDERKSIIAGLDLAHMGYPTEKTINSLFTEQVKRTPQHIAVQLDDEKITYAELDRRSTQLAAALKSYGIKTDDIIGLVMDRSIDLITGMLGVLKAGGAYLPIDTDYPGERIKYLIGDSGTQLVLTQNGCNFEWEGDITVLSMGEISKMPAPVHALADSTKPSDLCYVIYTSGTTGNPKGVMVEHRNLVRLFFTDPTVFNFNNSDVWTMFHSHCFDFSVWEIFGALLFGGRLIIIPKMISLDTNAYIDIIRKEKVTILNQTPGAFYNFIHAGSANEEGLPALRYVMLGGEALNPIRLKSWKEKHPAVTMINLYGITETTMYSTYKYLGEKDLAENTGNVGTPAPTSSIYILDDHGKIVPRGVRGEMYIGGAGVSRGYLGRKELTEQKFIVNPYNATDRLYRSGDQARLLPNGDIAYLGRIDQQVKINGFRIETGEIEYQLLQYNGIRQAVVIAGEKEQQKYLAGYYVSDWPIDTGLLRSYLLEHLPEYMVPAGFVHLPVLPLTGNGKLDRKALPDIEINSSGAWVPPAGETEEKLAEIWSAVLSVEKEMISACRSFFDLGGHSLNASQLVNRINTTFSIRIPLREIFIRQTIRQQAEYIQPDQLQMDQQQQKINKAAVRAVYPLSFSQRQLYFLYEYNKSSLAFNLPAAWKISGDVNPDKIRQAFNRLIQRHEILRTAFEKIDDEPVQKILPQVQLELVDITENEIRNGFTRPFDLAQPPLMRAALATPGNGEQLMVIDMHHIVADGISQSLLIKEFMALYNEELLPEPSVQYKDFAVWLHEEEQHRELAKQKEFWLKEVFADHPTTLQLPTDFPRPAVKSHTGKSVTYLLDKGKTSALRKIGEEQGATMFMVMLSLYNILLSKLSHQEDIITGTPFAGRNRSDLEKMVGLMITTLPMRNFPRRELSFRDFLANVKNRFLTALENQLYPYDSLVEELKIRRDTSRNPLFDVWFVYHNFEEVALEIPGLTLTPVHHGHAAPKFDLTLSVFERDGALLIDLEFAADLFREETAKQYLLYLRNIIEAVITGSHLKIADIGLVADKELLPVIEGASGQPQDKTIVALFAEQVKRTPQNMAIHFGNEKITYAELDRRSAQLATVLKSYGVKPGEIVGLLMPRSIDVVTAMLGVLRAGGAWLPIDTDYPRERIKYLIDDSRARLVLTQNGWNFEEGNNAIVLSMEEISAMPMPAYELADTSNPSDLCYVIYTSGTTGNPKGVMIEHRSLVNYIQWAAQYYLAENEKAVFALFTSISFDLTITSIFTPLVTGNSIVVYEEQKEVLPAKVFSNDLATVIKLTPTHLKILRDSDMDLSLSMHHKKLIVGGEDLETSTAQWIYSSSKGNITIYNEYGPTEATVGCMIWQYNEKDNEPSVPIGVPISNMRVYLLDEWLKPVPPGVEGELYISGTGVARGYLFNEAMTAARFIPDPQTAGGIMYKTGDVAIRNLGGKILFRGRTDEQVKIRGYRIEPAEITNELLKHEAIREAVVVVRETGNEKCLAAYYTAMQEIPGELLREYLSKKLPHYMVPAYYMQLKNLPVTINGKLDKKALPGIEIRTAASNELPRTTLQKELLSIWADALRVETDKIGIHANFFDIGGDSLKLIKIAGRVNRTLNVEVSVANLFRFPTIASLADFINESYQLQATENKTDDAQEMEQVQEAFSLYNQLRN